MGADEDRPRAATARVHVLHEGYVGERVASTVGFVRDGDVRVIIDPGMVSSPAAILDPLDRLGVDADDITDVILSHHHPDHTLHAALFPSARVHDYGAVYRGDVWTRRRAEGVEVSPSVRLLETPGHTPQCVTTLVGTDDGVVAFTHLWWTADGPAEDPYSPDSQLLAASRARVLAVADRIVPGHGPPFVADASTPR
jgi:glyoxylase-like metal-dependent hydrolase (beta-lactamase superfamily II)